MSIVKFWSGNIQVLPSGSFPLVRWEYLAKRCLPLIRIAQVTYTLIWYTGVKTADNTVTSALLNAGIRNTLFQAFHIRSTPPASRLWRGEEVWKEHSELAFSNLHAWWSPVCCQSLPSFCHLTFCLMLVCVWGAAATLIVHYFRERVGGGRERERG